MYKKVVTLLASTVILGLFSGCGKAQKVLIPVDNLTNKTVVLKKTTPFSDNAVIQSSIRKECFIETQLPEFVKEYSKNQEVNVILNDNASKENEYFLDLVITGAVSKGNAFLGHNKSTSVKGILYRKGNKIASFTGFRHSSGGFGAGFKGSCSVLGRTVDTLGEDISVWLKKPTLNDYIGQ